MNIQLKHRVIGAIIILALVIVFVPALFSKHAKEQADVIQSIPQPPTPPAVNTATTPDNTAVVTSTDQTTPDATSTAAPATQQPTMTNVVPTAAAQPAATPTQSTAPASPSFGATSPTADTGATTAPAMSAPTMPADNSSDMADSAAMVNSVKTTDTEADDLLKQAELIVGKSAKNNTGAHKNAANKKTSMKEVAKRLKTAKSYQKGWVIQLGSFNNRANADRLIKKLRAKGFDAYSEGVMASGKKMTKVVVGPVVHKDQALMMQKKIAQAFHVDTMLVKYNVNAR